MLKIRPPLTIDADGVDMILQTLRAVLAEVRVLRAGDHGASAVSQQDR